MRGVIITITGSDGSGKATQTKLLMERAAKEGFKIKTMSFPRYKEFWGKAVRFYLQGHFGTLDEVSPKDASMLFALDRLSAKEQIGQWLAEGHNIIFDRYMESNFGHQAGKYQGQERKEMLEWLHELEVKQFNLPESDLVLYLDLPVEHGIRAMEERYKGNSGAKDLHEKDTGHLVATQETYRQLVENNGNWISVSCLKDNEERYTREELAETMWLIVEPHLVKG